MKWESPAPIAKNGIVANIIIPFRPRNLHTQRHEKLTRSEERKKPPTKGSANNEATLPYPLHHPQECPAHEERASRPFWDSAPMPIAP
jgi:hypothetical protein